MNKPILRTDFRSTAKLSPRDKKRLNQYLYIASEVFGELLNEKLIPTTKTKSYEVSLLICGDKVIQELNREYRSKDKPTDVLSFPSHESLREISPDEDDIFLGDLAISVPTARRQAKEFNISVWDEFIHLYFHGLLHLIGHDHELSLKEEKLMQKWEDRALSIFSQKKRGL